MFDRVAWLKTKARTRSRGDFRAADADRRDAQRRLDVHETMGHLGEDEAAAAGLREAVDASASLHEIRQVFVEAGLPELPGRSPSTERRISAQDRAEAISLLEKAYAEGRLEPHECAMAKDQVMAARTRNEIDAAFHGLSSSSRAAAVKTASNLAEQSARMTTRVVQEGGRRAGKAFRRGVFAVGALMVGIILLIAGIGTLALVSFLLAVLLTVSAAVSLVTVQSRSSRS